MNKVYPERINFENEPSVATPLSASNLNKIDYATYEMDNRIIVLDANKANQTDELLDIKSVTYNATTGVWTFTHQNGTVDTFDQNIEKIPVTFSMDENGVITMTTADGTTYTCDVGTLIKTITFVNSGNIQFTVTTDAQGNKSVTANIIDGSVTRAKLDPNLLSQIDVAVASAAGSARDAASSANTASSKALDSEAYAIGTRGGVPVTSDDPAFENNSKYYAEHGASSLAGLTDVNISNVTNGQVIKYNSATHKWENDDESGGGGILPHLIVISETSSTVTATKGTTVITATETSTGHFECDLPEFGTWTIDAILGGDDAQVSLVVDTVKVYTVDDSHFHASVTVKYPTGATCNLAGQGESYYATGSPYTFTVHHAGNYTITVTYNGQTYTDTVTVTTTGQTFTKKVPTPSSAPANDIDWWLWFGDVSGTFSSLSDILADSTALATLMSSTDAIDYLVRCTSWISDICGNQSAMSYIGLNNYCANTLLADADWLEGIYNSAYMESVLNVKVPTMTSNTTPSGEVFASSSYSNVYPYYACDGNNSTNWYANATYAVSHIGYDFTEETNIIGAYLTRATQTDYSPAMTVSGSNDGNTYTPIKSFTWNERPQNNEYIMLFNSIVNYRYYKIECTNATFRMYADNMQFYGRTDV